VSAPSRTERWPTAQRSVARRTARPTCGLSVLGRIVAGSEVTGVKELVQYPESAGILRKKSEPSSSVSGRVRGLVQDLVDTLDAHRGGIGLAAPQIGAHSRVVVVRLGGGRDDASEPGLPLALINPEVIEARDEAEDFDGCLSFPLAKALPDCGYDVLRAMSIFARDWASGFRLRWATRKGDAARCYGPPSSPRMGSISARLTGKPAEQDEEGSHSGEGTRTHAPQGRFVFVAATQAAFSPDG